MSTGWENHEPAPIEFLHGKLHDYFHEFRRKKVGQENHEVLMNGSDLARIIAKAKIETYAKYPKQVNDKAILKSEL